MARIDIKTRDYIVESLDENFSTDLLQAIILRLSIHRGKYWANPNLGSRFYLLRRSKDVPRIRLLAIQYAKEALEDLKPSRVADIEVTASQSERNLTPASNITPTVDWAYTHWLRLGTLSVSAI